MGRRPSGTRALTSGEKQARRWERLVVIEAAAEALLPMVAAALRAGDRRTVTAALGLVGTTLGKALRPLPPLGRGWEPKGKG